MVNKALSLNFNFSFLNRISLLLNQLATLLSSRSRVDHVQDPILPWNVLGHSRGSNPWPLGWQLDVLINRAVIFALYFSLFWRCYLFAVFFIAHIVFAVHYCCTDGPVLTVQGIITKGSLTTTALTTNSILVYKGQGCPHYDSIIEGMHVRHSGSVSRESQWFNSRFSLLSLLLHMAVRGNILI